MALLRFTINEDDNPENDRKLSRKGGNNDKAISDCVAGGGLLNSSICRLSPCGAAVDRAPARHLASGSSGAALRPVVAVSPAADGRPAASESSGGAAVLPNRGAAGAPTARESSGAAVIAVVMVFDAW
jgi:hypothetical protein